MEEPEESNPNLWNLLIVLTVIVAATVTFMIFDHRDRGQGAAHHAKDSSKHKAVAEHHADSAHAEIVETSENKTVSSEPETEPAHKKAKVRETPVTSVNKTAVVTSDYTGEFVLIAASFRSELHAQKFVEDFQSKVSSMSPHIISHSQDNENFFRIIVSHSRSWKEISEAKTTLVDAGYADAWIYKHE